MPIIHAIALAITQGLTEFFPVSSSGHLSLLPWFFGWDDFANSPHLNKAFDVALHLGTLVGAIAYFWNDLVRYAKAGLALIFNREQRSNPTTDARVAWFLVASSVPGALTGLFLSDVLEAWEDKFWLIGVLLIVFGLILGWADSLMGTRKTEGFTLRDALLMGLGQAFALQPGVSRSGATMTVARVLGFERDTAARISFLMAIPIIAGAGLYSAVSVFSEGGIPADFRAPFAVGMATAAITGWLAVWATLRVVRNHGFGIFVAYRVVLGVVVIAVAASPWR